jgi:AraC family transcriptional regulator
MTPVNLEVLGNDLRRCELAGFSLVETVYRAGLKMPRHAHEPARMGLVLQGAYTERNGKKTGARARSTLVIHPPAEDHDVTFHNQVRIFSIDVKPQSLERVRECSPIFNSQVEFSAGQPVRLAMKLYNEFQKMDSVSPLAIEGLAFEILAEASRQKTNESQRQPPRWLERAKELIHAEFNEEITLASLAQAVAVHPVHLARQFRRHYRCTVGEYVRQLRIERACTEITKSSMSLAEVAAGIGFYDQSHFTNTFKRLTGMTPSQYRQAARPR